MGAKQCCRARDPFAPAPSLEVRDSYLSRNSPNVEPPRMAKGSKSRISRAGWGTAASMFLSLIASAQRSMSWRVRAGQAGLLDEVDGVPLALERARLFLSRSRNSTLDDILTYALLAHPARAFDHHIG